MEHPGSSWTWMSSRRLMQAASRTGRSKRSTWWSLSMWQPSRPRRSGSRRSGPSPGRIPARHRAPRPPRPGVTSGLPRRSHCTRLMPAARVGVNSRTTAPPAGCRHNWGAVRGFKSVYKKCLDGGTILSDGEWGAGNSQNEPLGIRRRIFLICGLPAAERAAGTNRDWRR